MLIKILLYVVLPYLICYLIASRVTRRYSLQHVSARPAGFGGFLMSSNKVLGGRFFATVGLALVFYGILVLVYFAVRTNFVEEGKAEESVATLEASSPEVNPANWFGLTQRAVFYTPNLKAIVSPDKRLPASDAKPTDGNYQRAIEAFSKGDLETAYINALASAERTYTFDALNLAANAGRRLGKNPEVAVLALAAADLAPESPYPWVHLAVVAQAEGKDDLCAACCDRAEALGPEDAWVRDQVKALRAALTPVEPIEPTTIEKDPRP